MEHPADGHCRRRRAVAPQRRPLPAQPVGQLVELDGAGDAGECGQHIGAPQLRSRLRVVHGHGRDEFAVQAGRAGHAEVAVPAPPGGQQPAPAVGDGFREPVVIRRQGCTV